jgi:hypothetical protein
LASWNALNTAAESGSRVTGMLGDPVYVWNRRA